MSTKIVKNIVAFEVVKKDEIKEEQTADIEHMHESVQRPELLMGSTYKIKTPNSEHALYVTINDIILNQGTEHELRRPFEMFINSKNMDQFQWIVALTRVASAVFRKGGDVTFLAEELKAVFDPHGGYFKRGGKFMPSVVAEIGDALEKHFTMIGLLKKPELPEHQQAILDEKRAEFEKITKGVKSTSNEASDFPEEAQLCKKCHTKAAILMDGCLTCLSCGDSKCG
ncbi:MAG: NrdJb [Bermanella sp.]